MFKKCPSEIKNVTKSHSFLFHKLQLITVLLLICYSCMNCCTSFVSLKLCVGFSTSDSISIYQSLCFCSTRTMNSLTLKRHDYF